MSHIELHWAAMYVSELWYGGFYESKSLYCKTRGIVLFDRLINGRIELEKA